MNKIVADVALVHGAGFELEGSRPIASAYTRAQTLLGVDMLEQGSVEALVFCGRGPNLDDVYTTTEADMMKRIALDAGVPEVKIFTETESVSTLGNWAYGAIIASSLGVERIVGVSRPSHFRRANMCAEFVTRRTGLQLVGYKLIDEDIRLSSRARELGQVALINRFLNHNQSTPVNELPDLYEKAKSPLKLNAIKRFLYSSGTVR
jgi:vancomycin permeability regulator SanA